MFVRVSVRCGDEVIEDAFLDPRDEVERNWLIRDFFQQHLRYIVQEHFTRGRTGHITLEYNVDYEKSVEEPQLSFSPAE